MTLSNWNTLGQYGQRWPHDAGQTLRLWTSHPSLYVTANRLFIFLLKTNSYPKNSLLTAHFRKWKVLLGKFWLREFFGEVGGAGWDGILCIRESGRITVTEEKESARWAKRGVLGCTGTGAALSVELGCKLTPLSPYLPIYDQGITPGACYLRLVKPKIFHNFSLHAHQTCPEIKVTVSCVDIRTCIHISFLFLKGCSILGKVLYLRTPC